MIIYLVMKTVQYEGDTVLSAYDTELQAMQIRKKYEQARYEGHHYWVDEFEVNNESEGER